MKRNVYFYQQKEHNLSGMESWGEERGEDQMTRKAKSTLNCNFLVGVCNSGYSLVLAKDPQMDYENLHSVESIGCVVAAGEGPSSCCVVVAVVGTSFVVVGTSFVVAVVEPFVPFAHWVWVLCCWTLQMDLVGYNDEKGSVYPWIPHVHNLHFGVEVVFWHFHLHTDCPIIGYQTHRPGLIKRRENELC